METLIIHSGLEHFRWVERIKAVTANGLDGDITFSKSPIFTGLEAMAQLAALHVRFLLNFERHAFLLNVKECRMPAKEILDGPFVLSAGLSGQSKDAFMYRARAQHIDHIDHAVHDAFQCAVLIGTQAYDDRFERHRLKAYYQERFEVLTQ